MTEPPSETPDSARLVGVTLDEHTVVRRNPDVEHERAVAIYDLLEENLFRPCSGVCGPFRLHLAVQENRLLFDIRSEAGAPVETVSLSLGSFRTVVRDYFLICESYYNAIRKLTPSQIEAIDMGRRGLHNEGAELLRDRLAGKVEIDRNTARRLFTLVCVLHLR